MYRFTILHTAAATVTVFSTEVTTLAPPLRGPIRAVLIRYFTEYRELGYTEKEQTLSPQRICVQLRETYTFYQIRAFKRHRLADNTASNLTIILALAHYLIKENPHHLPRNTAINLGTHSVNKLVEQL